VPATKKISNNVEANLAPIKWQLICLPDPELEMLVLPCHQVPAPGIPPKSVFNHHNFNAQRKCQKLQDFSICFSKGRNVNL
jgi:hypothetical protein